MTKDELAENNIMLVHSIAHKYPIAGYEYDDIFGYGMIGLAYAINKFDPSKGIAFTSYAVPVITHRIWQLARDNKRKKHQGDVVSLEEPIPGTRELTYKDALISDEDVEEEAIEKTEIQSMRMIISQLPDKHRKVCEAMLNGEFRGRQLGKIIGCSQPQGARVKQQAIAKIRALMM